MSQSVTYSVSQSLSGRVANKRNDIRLIDVHTPTNQLIDRFNERFAGEREQRMCVVCQEREKTTLLMPTAATSASAPAALPARNSRAALSAAAIS